jgi:hypothetical protein
MLLPRLSLLLAVASVLIAADVRIAVLNKDEIRDLLQIRILAKPENAAARLAIKEADQAVQELHTRMGAIEGKDDQARKVLMQEMSAVHQRKRDAEAAVEGQIEAEFLRVVKPFIVGKYAVALDASYVGEAVITKDADLVDITLDIKEKLLTQ